jgi:tetratricopeptide (TPR) repeat protein
MTRYFKVGCAVVLAASCLAVALVSPGAGQPDDRRIERADALVAQGLLHSCRGEYEGALAELDQAIRLAPQDALSLVNRGLAWHGKKEYDKALADFDQAIRLDPRCAQAFHSRSLVRQARGEHDLALADCDAALRLDPGHVGALFSRGVLRFYRGEYDQALADLDRAVGLAAQEPLMLVYRGLVRNARGEYGPALADVAAALDLDPDLPAALYARALVLATCPDAHYRDGKKAVESARRACELTEWKAPDCLDVLAAACAEAGDFTRAVRCQEQALDFPDFAAAQGDKARQRLRLYRAGKPLQAPPDEEASGTALTAPPRRR